MRAKSLYSPERNSKESLLKWVNHDVNSLTKGTRQTFCNIGKLALEIFGIAMLMTITAHADTPRLNDIQRAARELIIRETQSLYPNDAQIEVGQIDSRLRLTPCEQDLKAFITPGSRLLGTVHVGVRCTSNQPWLVYVPVNISVQDTVLIASRPLPRGYLLTDQDFSTVKQDIKDLPPGYLRDATAAIGKQLKQPIAPGIALTDSSIEQSILVKRGEPVTIVALNSGIEVRAAGQAMNNASLGQSVEVRNLSSKRSIRGRVTGPGVVQVEL